MIRSTIRKLPPRLISLIAAGEVIERPLNIVKELVENSIDAKATKITIQLDRGGIDGVTVQDDGFGIIEQEISHAFEIHTTSKLANEDISRVSSLGFRGEALSSIAAVSRVECLSKTEDSKFGTHLILEGGKQISKETVNIPLGTTIKVFGIFFNTPARRKFLKKPLTERKRITELISGFCLEYPEIHFLLEEKDDKSWKKRLESPSRKNRRDVIEDIMGHEIMSNLIHFRQSLSNWDVEGFISKPLLIRSDRTSQYLSVNGRIVRNIEIQKAIENGYGSQLMKSVYPIFVLSIKGDVTNLDFNIHPQKTEIRFRADDAIIDELSSSISETLANQSDLQYLPPSGLEIVQPDLNQFDFEKSEPVPDSIGIRQSEEMAQKNVTYQTSLTEDEPVLGSNNLVLGHIMDKFGVVLSSNNELWLIDIHAADERVKFEKFESSSHREALAQEFLEPLTIQLLPAEANLLIENYLSLEKFGVRISRGSRSKVLIHSFPVYFDMDLTQKAINHLISDLISYFNNENESLSSTTTPLDRIEYNLIARLACHGSIRSGSKVSKLKIMEILDALLKCKNPWTCAHGRPTVLKLTKNRLETWFNR